MMRHLKNEPCIVMRSGRSRGGGAGPNRGRRPADGEDARELAGL